MEDAYDRAAKKSKANLQQTDMDMQIRKFHNKIKQELLLHFKNESLLDLACGRGGDIAKWMHANYKNVTAIDFSAESIAEAHSRMDMYKYLAKSTKIKFQIFDLKQKLPELERKYDTVSCMFALHYFLETKETALTFFTNVSNSLNKNGVFLGVGPDGKNILALLNGNSFLKNDFVCIEKKFDGKQQCFGSGYLFSMQNSILQDEKSLEFLMFENVLIEIAKKVGLIPILDLDLPGFLLKTEPQKLFKHFNPQYEDKDKNTTSEIFAAFAFRKA